MYLTQFDINMGRRDARRLVGSPERIHAAVLGCFPPGQASTDHGRTLWRMDRGRESHSVHLMIVSPLPPDLRALNEQAGWETGSPGRTADYDRFLADLSRDQTWRFRITANPTTTIRPRAGSKERGKRLAHVTAAQQLKWLVDRAGRCGFALPADAGGEPSATVAGRDLIKFRRGTDGTGRTVTLAKATFDGVLQVSDANALRRALVQGIGPAKGYGCGLMTLAPLA